MFDFIYFLTFIYFKPAAQPRIWNTVCVFGKMYINPLDWATACWAFTKCKYSLITGWPNNVILKWGSWNNMLANVNYKCHQSSSLAIEVLKGSVKMCQGNYRNALPRWCLWIRFAIMMTNSVWWMHPHCWECCGGGRVWQTSTSGFWSTKQWAAFRGRQQ